MRADSRSGVHHHGRVAKAKEAAAMRISYDQAANALYIFLSDTQAVQGVEMDGGTIVDLDAQGGIRGIEVINPGRAWPLDEVLERFDVGVDDALALRALWPGEGRFPYANVGTLAVVE
jgi:uncharacterized protein YuzE